MLDVVRRGDVLRAFDSLTGGRIDGPLVPFVLR